MGDADTAFQGRHGARIEYIADQAGGLLHAQAAAAGGGDTRRVLATVLEDGQAVIQLPGDVLVADDSDDATHGARSPLGLWGPAGAPAPRPRAAAIRHPPLPR
ncbi:hypothetical protein G6F22_019714 [Rhizopus arrhizus]|nr:hypothetical protein G6F22_019714 [Rhizopus arrhizus]KAG1258037.1 hypothetical protein G6F65_015712 [Rhizopus arrhizus]